MAGAVFPKELASQIMEYCNFQAPHELNGLMRVNQFWNETCRESVVWEKFLAEDFLYYCPSKPKPEIDFERVKVIALNSVFSSRVRDYIPVTHYDACFIQREMPKDVMQSQAVDRLYSFYCKTALKLWGLPEVEAFRNSALLTCIDMTSLASFQHAYSPDCLVYSLNFIDFKGSRMGPDLLLQYYRTLSFFKKYIPSVDHSTLTFVEKRPPLHSLAPLFTQWVNAERKQTQDLYDKIWEKETLPFILRDYGYG